MYSCFVDFQKALDIVIHPGLLSQAKEFNINRKFHDILSGLYAKRKFCARQGEYRTNCLESKAGVRRGDMFNTSEFKVFINDLPDYLIDSPDPVHINDLPLNFLMYADDILWLSTSSTGLQGKINKLSKFCQDRFYK